MGRRLQEPSSPPSSKQPATTTATDGDATAATGATAAAAVEETSTEEASATPESSDTSSSHNSQDAGPDPTEVEWSFSFEQVLASLLNEPSIVNFFERPVDFQTKMGQAKVGQLKLKAK